jgi:nonsense-mediated mRNA decay protein 3
VQNVTIQQRVMTELRCAFQMCPDCNREYTNRTWQAVLQVRQRCHTTKGLRALEMAIAKADPKVRKHVIRLDSTNAGLDFYFLELRQAQQLCQFIAAQYPSRTKVTQKFVSEDVKNNTANIKHTVHCELAPLAKDDLLVVEANQGIPHSLAGRLALITHVSAGLVQCVDAVTMERTDITAELYYKYEKYIHVVPCSTIRAIVLDVESLAHHQTSGGGSVPQPSHHQQQHPSAVLHEVQLWLGAHNDEVVTATTHVGMYLTAGDTVLAYDLRNSTVSMDDDWLQHSYELPDVVVIKKTKPMHDDDETVPESAEGATDSGSIRSTALGGNNSNKKLSKKKERRQRKENRRMKELEERAVRMGFVESNNDDDDNEDGNGVLENEIADDISRLESQLEDFGDSE